MGGRALLNCILALSLAVSLSGCSDPAVLPDSSLSAPQPDLSVTEPVSVQPLTLAADISQSFHPLLTRSRVNLTLTPLIYEGLFRLDPSFTPQPALCRSFQSDESGLVWSFDLREDATFSDGTPLTASAVVRSLELARTDRSHYAGRFSCIQTITAEQDHRLTITLSRPNTGLPALLDIPVVLGEGDHPLGTGPFVLTEGAENSLSLLPRSQDRQPIQLLSISRTRQMTSAFEQGNLSLVTTDPSGTDSPGFSGAYSTVNYDTTALIYLGFNTARSAFSAPQRRAAAAAALDRSALVSAGWSGHARACALPIHPASPLYDESLSRQLPTPDEADSLMTSSNLAGRTVTLLVNTENSYKVSAARLIAQQLEQAGLKVSLSTLPWADYLTALTEGRFDLYLGEVTLSADFDLTPLIAGDGELNYTRWQGRECDRLLTEFLSAPQESRAQAASDLCAYLTQQSPIAPLCFKQGSVLTRWDGSSALTPTRADVFFGLF